MWFRLFALAVVVSLTLAQGNQKYYKHLGNIKYMPLANQVYFRQRSGESGVNGGGYLNPRPEGDRDTSMEEEVLDIFKNLNYNKRT
ncbi:unnamed protein product [Cylicocyclus nassatus]|uniref:Uncharacterized protein n=1 Tax=Cylicocyclus nassatus TaxID=53992 RepID=A0AA36GU36_CYLNA|nr:unnamed protein product [Cylicocyclus nassatus]